MQEHSAPHKRIELARPGTYGDVVVTPKDLAEIAATFQGDAPIVIGHDMARRDTFPRFGSVTAVLWQDAARLLLGDIELNDLLAEAWDNKLYTKWSIGSRLQSDGRRYLHHLAILGAVPPAVKGLKLVNLSDAAQLDIWTFSDPGSELPPSNNQPNNHPNNTHKEEGMSQPTPNGAEQEPKPTPDAGAPATPAPAAGAPPASSDSQKNQELADTQAKLATAQAALRDQARAKLTASLAGKIPKEKHADIVLLADAYADTLITLSDGASKRTAYELLSDIFAALPAPVTPGALGLELSDSARASGNIPINKM